VPIYEALRVRRVEDLNKNVMLEVIEEQAEQGVDDDDPRGVLIQHIPLMMKRINGIGPARGSIWANGW
jgi:phosphomethylpyrimidine synthase